MPVPLEVLEPRFQTLVRRLIKLCAEQGVEMRPYQALRTPLEQARYWRQSRSREEIRRKVEELRRKQAPFLADCIERVGPQFGPEITRAIPGLSWHQWGEAVDCFWVVKGRAEWSTQKKVGGSNGYHVYADEARRIGLTAGGHWTRFRDWPHVQLRESSSPLKEYKIAEVDRIMRIRFQKALDAVAPIVVEL